MTKLMSRVLEDIQELSNDEKSNLIKILISTLDKNSDENSDDEWADLSLKRYEEIKSQSVHTLNWNEIKQSVLNR